MKKKLSEYERSGVKVGEVISSTGTKMYSIFKVGEVYTCDCMGYAIRKRCRHIEQFRYANEDHRPNGVKEE